MSPLHSKGVSALSSLTVTFKISSFGQEPVNGAPPYGVNWIHRWRIDSRRVQWTRWKPIGIRNFENIRCNSMDSRMRYILSVIINDPSPMDSMDSIEHFDQNRKRGPVPRLYKILRKYQIIMTSHILIQVPFPKSPSAVLVRYALCLTNVINISFLFF